MRADDDTNMCACEENNTLEREREREIEIRYIIVRNNRTRLRRQEIRNKSDFRVRFFLYACGNRMCACAHMEARNLGK